MTYEELEPKSVFSYFKKLSAIPRGSGNERAAAEFVRDTAHSLGCEAEIDASNNVLVRAKATPGCENREPIALQGHLDMVCEANRGTKHDFLRDPIELVLTGDELRANGTTLGADDGVAASVALAVLESDQPHPALECLFTTEEETGLTGMRNFDASKLVSRRLINIDSAGEGVATVSCAGGVRSHIRFPLAFETIPDGRAVLELEITGLAGGHSGEDINLGRKNAIATAARLLWAANKADPTLCLASITGGMRDNAIPRECAAVFTASDPSAVEKAVRDMEEKLRGELVPEDKDMKVSLRPAEADTRFLKPLSDALVCLLRSLPCGVYGMSRLIPDLVETSSNLAVVRAEGDCLHIVVSSRSSVESMLDDMQDRVECAAFAAGATVEHNSRYPGWEFADCSPLQELYLETWKELFGTDARAIGIHAGLECGLMKGKLPDMDMISIGPDVKNLHSPDEVLGVSSLARLYRLVCAMLEKA